MQCYWAVDCAYDWIFVIGCIVFCLALWSCSNVLFCRRALLLSSGLCAVWEEVEQNLQPGVRSPQTASNPSILSINWIQLNIKLNQSDIQYSKYKFSIFRIDFSMFTYSKHSTGCPLPPQTASNFQSVDSSIGYSTNWVYN